MNTHDTEAANAKRQAPALRRGECEPLTGAPVVRALSLAVSGSLPRELGEGASVGRALSQWLLGIIEPHRSRHGLALAPGWLGQGAETVTGPGPSRLS
jgi:hypothetical protein